MSSPPKISHPTKNAATQSCVSTTQAMHAYLHCDLSPHPLLSLGCCEFAGTHRRLSRYLYHSLLRSGEVPACLYVLEFVAYVTLCPPLSIALCLHLCPSFTRSLSPSPSLSLFMPISLCVFLSDFNNQFSCAKEPYTNRGSFSQRDLSIQGDYALFQPLVIASRRCSV